MFLMQCCTEMYIFVMFIRAWVTGHGRCCEYEFVLGECVCVCVCLCVCFFLLFCVLPIKHLSKVYLGGQKKVVCQICWKSAIFFDFIVSCFWLVHIHQRLILIVEEKLSECDSVNRWTTKKCSTWSKQQQDKERKKERESCCLKGFYLIIDSSTEQKTKKDSNQFTTPNSTFFAVTYFSSSSISNLRDHISVSAKCLLDLNCSNHNCLFFNFP